MAAHDERCLRPQDDRVEREQRQLYRWQQSRNGPETGIGACARHDLIGRPMMLLVICRVARCLMVMLHQDVRLSFGTYHRRMRYRTAKSDGDQHQHCEKVAHKEDTDRRKTRPFMFL